MLARLVLSQKAGRMIDVRVVSLTELGSVGSELRSSGVPVITLGWRGVVDLPRVLWRLVQVLRDSNADVVQTWMYHADLVGGLAARVCRIRSVVWGIRTVMLPENAPWSTRAARLLCAKLSAVLPTAIVCNSEAARRYHESLGYRASKMRVIPNGFELEELVVCDRRVDQARASWGLKKGQQAVGMLGRNSPDKDPMNFIAAMSSVLKSRDDVVAIMIGRGFDLENPSVREMISSASDPSRFVLAGETSDPAEALAALDVFVLPSKTESFPNVVAEAMAMKRPSVVTDVGDARQIIADCGMVVPPEDHEALAAGVLRILELPLEERDALGMRARRRVEDEYSLEKVTDHFDQLYAETAHLSARVKDR